MYVDEVPNRNSKPAILLRESKRRGDKVDKITIANISHWPKEKIEALKKVLKNEDLVRRQDIFKIERSLPHGHVKAVLGTLRKIGLEQMISSKRCAERDLVVAAIVSQILFQTSKLGSTRRRHDTTLAGELGVEEADENDVYAAMDWLAARQSRIEKKLAKKHLSEGGLILYDVSSSYYEGRTCPLTRFGHSRDGKKGRPIIVYGVMTDERGCPVAVDVYPGNTADPTTVPDQVDKLRERFGLERVVLVGDRGMLTQTQIDKLREHPGIGWISALKSCAIKELVEAEHIQPSLFDERNLAEISSDDFPNERLVVCRNPLLGDDRKRTRDELLDATEIELVRIQKEIAKRKKKLMSEAEIAQKVEAHIGRYKMRKHFHIIIRRSLLLFQRNKASIKAEEALDGIYVVRTSESEERLSSEDTVRCYKKLTDVEQLFRTLKGIDIKVRPIRHRDETRVKAHIFICKLAYYVEWHMRRKLAALLFDDEELEQLREARDPVAKAEPSASARRKKKIKKTEEGFEVHSFDSLLAHLATQCRNRCSSVIDPDAPPFFEITDPTLLQREVYELLDL